MESKITKKRKEITPKQSTSKKQSSSSGAQAPIPMMSSNPPFPMMAVNHPLQRTRFISTSSTASESSVVSVVQAPQRQTTTKNGPIGPHDLGGIKYGKMRNIIEVDILLIDGEDYKTNITEQEIFKYVCRKTLGIRRNVIFGIQLSWSGHPLAQIRLTEALDVDSLPPNFSYEKETINPDGSKSKQVITCSIRGVGQRPFNQERTNTRPVEDPNGPWTRWVKLEGTGFEFEKPMLEKWLRNFGTLESAFENDMLNFEDDIFDDDEDASTPKSAAIASGKLSVKMQITESIPQFLPANGKKIKVYYRGIDKLCVNCYRGGHMRAECRENRTSWIEYIELFKETYPEIDQALYGRWNHTLAAWKSTQINHE